VLNAPFWGLFVVSLNGVKIMDDIEVVDGYACPTDPALATLCEACE
jgi:hypothetical protein